MEPQGQSEIKMLKRKEKEEETIHSTLNLRDMY